MSQGVTPEIRSFFAALGRLSAGKPKHMLRMPCPYCGSITLGSFSRAHQKPILIRIPHCRWCDRPFEPVRFNNVFCSKVCANAFWNAKASKCNPA